MKSNSARGLEGARQTLTVKARTYHYYALNRLPQMGFPDPARLPYSIKILLESAMRHRDGSRITDEDIRRLAGWKACDPVRPEILYKPARVILQDFTGVPALADLAAMRSAAARLGGDIRKVNPGIPCDLVVDHSVQVDAYGARSSYKTNLKKEFSRNKERYEFIKWGQSAFRNFRVVPPGMGIVHQVNLEYLACGVRTEGSGEALCVYPDSVVGTDSHTTHIGGLGVLGWGVGGIEAEAVMLGEPMSMLVPDVIGVRLEGRLREGVTATDLVLTITQILRQKGVVGKFVEFCGDGISSMSLPDRATLSNMAPEYGATIGFFPADDETLRYYRLTGRSPKWVELAERYLKDQGLFREAGSPEPEYTDVVEINLASVEPTLAGPKRPQDKLLLKETKGRGGMVAIAAITSCTNTSNPSVMIGAGLLAQKAVKKGLKTPPHVKTSLAPGSRVVTAYLSGAGLLAPLEKLGFNLVGYGCTTCIGNSGPLPKGTADRIQRDQLTAASVLSGNRNFEGRIHPLVKANFLASPALVVAFALAGTTEIDLTSEPLGKDKAGRPVFLKDIWPTDAEIAKCMARAVKSGTFKSKYKNIFRGSSEWRSIRSGRGDLFPWKKKSSYIHEPPFFAGFKLKPPPSRLIQKARVLALLGDSVTTDHISPAGAIAPASPAGRYLMTECGVKPKDFNSYGSRRGNDRVMTRGTFANARLRNRLVPGSEGSWTMHFPSGRAMSIYEAARRYSKSGMPLVVIAGKEYGTGSSRDWAAKGAALLGVRAVIAESFERIHRQNLVGMGVLPLEFEAGASAVSLGIKGDEILDIEGIGWGIKPGQAVVVKAASPAGGPKKVFNCKLRIDTPVEAEQYRHGGILPMILRKMLNG